MYNMISSFESKLTDIASSEFQKFGGRIETDPLLAGRIKDYWTGLGLKFPGVATPWSAVFVSWCVKNAGATKNEFRFSAQHSVFVKAAIDNSMTNSGVFRGVRFDEVMPAIGDIIQWNRGGGKIDFATAASSHNYASHSAIVIVVGQDNSGRFVMTIGGNEADMIGRTRIPLNDAGLIIQSKKTPFISIIQTLK